MINRIFNRVLRQFMSNEQLVDKLSESKPIKRAAQVTAYTIIKAQRAAEKSYKEFQAAGGYKKLKEVTNEDINEVRGRLKEFITYDLYRGFRKAVRDVTEKVKDSQRKY